MNTRVRSEITTCAVWNARTVGDSATWTHTLGSEARNSIIEAATRLRKAGTTIDTISRGDFDLEVLRPLVRSWTDELVTGRGFVLVRGFPVDRLDADAIQLAYFGLGMQLGNPVSQDSRGTLLGHVRDAGVPRTSPSVRRYATNERQDFHTDGADIIGLLCLHTARKGGESRIASAAAVYNEILSRDPNALEVLYAPMYWDRNDEQSPGDDPYFALPVLTDVGGQPRFFYIGWYIRDAQRHSDVPRLTDGQLAAMQLVEDIANDPTFHIEMKFRPGDIQLLNNAVILHSRESYEDDPDPTRRRHLLRLWLAARDVATVNEALRDGIPVRRD